MLNSSYLQFCVSDVEIRMLRFGFLRILINYKNLRKTRARYLKI